MRTSALLFASAVISLAPVITGCGAPGGKSNQPPNEAKLTKPSKRAPAPPPVRDVVITPQQIELATTVLRNALKSSDGLIRAHTIEAISDAAPQPFEAQIIAGLEDPAPIVRTSAAMSIGELKLTGAREALLKRAGDEDNLVQIAVRFALHRLGDTRLTHDFELFAQSDKPQVRGMTVLALGMLGEPSAMKLLRPMQADRNATVRLQVYEAMWKLGSEQGLASLAAAALSAYPDDQMIAFLALAEPRDKRVIEHVRGGLTSDYEETRLVAARAMGMLGSDEGYTIATAATKSVDPRKRHLAALAFAAIGRKDAIDLVVPLLSDGNTDVKLAAATAVLTMGK